MTEWLLKIKSDFKVPTKMQIFSNFPPSRHLHVLTLKSYQNLIFVANFKLCKLYISIFHSFSLVLKCENNLPWNLSALPIGLCHSVPKQKLWFLL